MYDLDQSFDHIPGSRNHLLALAAGVGVKPVSQEQKAHLTAHVSILLILTSASTKSGEEQDEPWQTDLEEHLEIQPSEQTWVELSTHEEIVDVVTSHSVLSTTRKSGDVSNDTDEESGADGHGHDWAEFINQSVELENSGDMQSQSENDTCVECPDTVAVVRKLLTAEVSKRLTLAVHAGKREVEDTLHDEKDPVDDPGSRVWECAGVSEVEKMLAEVGVGLIW